MNYVGIDLHKKESQICTLREGGQLGDCPSSPGNARTQRPCESSTTEGTTVSLRIVRALSPLYPFEEDLKHQGFKLQTRLIGCQRAVVTPKFVQRGLRLPTGAKVGLLRMLRLVDLCTANW
jgi:hypothetical protein